VYKSVVCLAETSSYDCPTLLHLSARYGLEKLAARLVDLPDARLACHVKDRHGSTPEDVALQRQHRSLASFLHNFIIETVSGFQSVGLRYSNAKYLRFFFLAYTHFGCSLHRHIPRL